MNSQNKLSVVDNKKNVLWKRFVGYIKDGFYNIMNKKELRMNVHKFNIKSILNFRNNINDFIGLINEKNSRLYKKTVGLGNVKSLSLKSLVLVVIILIKSTFSIVFCATQDEINAVGDLQNVIRDMTDEELDAFNNEIRFELPRGWPYNVENQNVPPNHIYWQAISIFVIGSILLFVYSRYHNQINEVIFNDLPTMGHIIYEGFAASMRSLGYAAIFRVEVAQQAQTLLDNPDTASRVVNALRVVHQMRQQTR